MYDLFKDITPPTEEPTPSLFDNISPQSYESVKNNDEIKKAAVRFARDRYENEQITEDEAITEFIEHFRSFDINELTAGTDWNYVSAISSDAQSTDLRQNVRDEAKQKLEDYTLLYKTYREMPSFYEEGGAPGAFGDYLEGFATAPSTYVGLLLPGAGKTLGVAATQASKVAVNKAIQQAARKGIFRKGFETMGRNPLVTAMGVEGFAGGLQDISAQNVEQEINLRPEGKYDYMQLTASTALSALGPAIPVGLAKGLGQKYLFEGGKDANQELNKILNKLNETNKVANDKASKTLSENKTEANKIKTILPVIGKKGKQPVTKKELDPKAVRKGIKKRKELEQEIDITPDSILAIDPKRTERIFAATVDILQKGGGLKTFPDGRQERITEGISRVIRELGDEKAQKLFKGVYKDYNLSSDDFANLWVANVAEAARTLSSAGKSQKALNAISGLMDDGGSQVLFGITDSFTKEINNIKKSLGKKGKEHVNLRNILNTEVTKITGKQRLGPVAVQDQLRLALMTSSTATTVRNTLTGAGRVTLDVLVKSLDRGIAQSLKVIGGAKGKKGISFNAPNADVLATLYAFANGQQTKVIDEIFKIQFHNKATKLYRELADISSVSADSATGKIRFSESLARDLNSLNTLSDNMFKRVAFISNLKRNLNEMYEQDYAILKLNPKSKTAKDFMKKTGKSTIDKEDFNLFNIVKNNQLSQVFGTESGKARLNKSIEDALHFTYQRTPDNPVTRAFINGIHRAPFLATSFIPFPRFLVNALEFTYEYSPLYLASQSWKRATVGVDSPNYEDLAKGLVGTGMLTGAYAFRMQSPYAGEKWYEMKLANGATFDARPFFPAAPYLFFGDLLANYTKGNPIFADRNFTLDAINALTGSQFRAGMGLYSLDQAIEDIFSFRDSENAETFEEGAASKFFTNMAANIVNTYTIPITPFQDVYNTFFAEDDARIIRQTQSSDLTQVFLNRALSRVPGNYIIDKKLSQVLPIYPSEPKEIETREEKLRRVTPITRQMTGALLTPKKNPIEKEIARLKLPFDFIFRKTGVPEADQFIRNAWGEVSNDVLNFYVQSSEYEQLSDADKRRALKNVINSYRDKVANAYRMNNDKYSIGRYGFDTKDRRDFLNIQSATAKEQAIQLYNDQYLDGNTQDLRAYDYALLYDIAKELEKREKDRALKILEQSIPAVPEDIKKKLKID